MRSLSVGVALLLLAAVPAGAQTITAEQIADGLGLSAQDKKKALAGKIVVTEIEETDEKQLAVALALVVPAGLDDIADSLLEGTTLEANTALQAYGDIDPTQIDEAAFAGLTLDDDEVKTLLKLEPGSDFNMSTDEIAVFQDLGQQYQAGDAGAADAVNAAYRQMLAGRMQAYVDGGLAGIAPYDRGGDSSSAADDLKIAAESATLLQEVLPELYQAFVAYPDQAVADVEHGFNWVQVDAGGRPAQVLTHRMLYRQPDLLVVLARGFYVSHSFNASQYVSGMLPVDGGTAIFYANRTATDQVAGFMSSARHLIGRGMMRDGLILWMNEIQEIWQP